MARPSRDAIETFISITAAPEAVALRKLEEHGGNLSEAINAHFVEVDRVFTNHGSVPAPPEDLMNIDGPSENNHIESTVVDSVEPMVEGINGNATSHDLASNDTIVIDVSDNEDIQVVHAVHGATVSPDTSFSHGAGPSISHVDLTDSNNDLEEEMIRAAIEASKKETEQDVHNQNLHGHLKSPVPDVTDLARAVSLSLETAKQERELSEQDVRISKNSSSTEEGAGADAHDGRHRLPVAETGTSSQVNSEEMNPSVLEKIDSAEEQPSVGHNSRHTAPVNAAPVDSEQAINSASSPQHDMDRIPQQNGHAITDEWGGMSSVEQDEAVMLEAAMFGIPEGVAYRFGYPHQTGSYGNPGGYPRVPRPPSPSLIAQRLLREQQDDEYLASLQADREKELKAQQEAEIRQLEEAAAREVALEKQKLEQEESHRKLLEKEELERKLAAKEASLPSEPSENENAVTLLVRMPDGSRRGRRFLKFDKLQFLFDYIDIGKGVEPGSYRLVRPYPRRAFTLGESEMSMSELGLTSKQEALFMELI